MKQTAQLIIRNPCQEDWNKMIPEEKGRFCLNCQKTVIDMTKLSDAALMQLIEQSAHGLCGRFHSSQLNRDIYQYPAKKPGLLRYSWNMLLAFLLFSSKSNAKAPGNGKYSILSLPGKLKTSPALVNADSARLYIRGNVKDNKGMPVSYASVIIKDGREGVLTDSAGNFRLNVTGRKLPLTLIISSVGYKQLEWIVTESSVNQEQQLVFIAMEQMVMGDFWIVTKVKKKKKLNPITGILKKKNPEVCKPGLVPASIKVFPNPAKLQQAVNLNLAEFNDGNWNLTVLSAEGNAVYTNEIEISDKVQQASIPAGAIKIPGLYIINLVNHPGSRIVTAKLVVQ